MKIMNTIRLTSGERMNLFTTARKLDSELGTLVQNEHEITLEMIEDEQKAVQDVCEVFVKKAQEYSYMLELLKAKLK